MTERTNWIERIGGVLTIGFGATVAMWIVGYLTHIPGMRLPSAGVFFLLLAILFTAGIVSGRVLPNGAISGLTVGLTVGSLNLLVLGSLISGDEPNQVTPSAAIFVPGWLVMAALVGAAGAYAGRRPRSMPASPNHWPGRFSLVAVAATLLLIPAGGVVTGFEAGLAVPDWPNSFGYNMFLYPLSRMTGGIYYEHTHRLIGSLVGLTTLVLTAYLWFAESRLWVKIYATILLAAVIFQGVMGGLRVTDQSIQLAVAHGVFAQCFLAGLCGLAVVTATRFRDGPPAEPHPAAALDRSIGVAAVAGLLIQTTLGALVRHLGWALQLHIIMAVVVAAIVFFFALRCWGAYEKSHAIPSLGGILIYLVGGQLMLGIGALVVTGIEPQIPIWVQVIVTTAHQTTGALLLALSTTLVIWHVRLHAVIAPGMSVSIDGSAPAPSTGSSAAHSAGAS